MGTDQLMDKLIKAVSYKYGDDKTSPGVTVSALKKGYYCSIVRYDGAFAKDKQVVCASRGDNLCDVLKELAGKFVALSPQTKNPLQELSDLVGNL